MPTFDRTEWAVHAAELFLAQDYPAAELIVVEDGEPRLAAELPRDPRIRLDETHDRITIGALRNRGIESARGDIIVCWDDDDWFGPERISRQVEPIIADRADVAGLAGFDWLELDGSRSWEIRPEHQDRLLFHRVACGAIAFRRALFDSGIRYPDESHGEDLDFITRLVESGARLEAVEAHGFFVYVRHARSTWRAESRYGGTDSWQPGALPGLSAYDLAFLRKRAAEGAAEAVAP
jgi:glycosyltransferase involved in cell wall biosynthesis